MFVRGYVTREYDKNNDVTVEALCEGYYKTCGKKANYLTVDRFLRLLRNGHYTGKEGRKLTQGKGDLDAVYIPAIEKLDKSADVRVEEERSDTLYKCLIESSFIKTPEQAIEYLKIDTGKWELKEFRRGSWGSENNPCFQLRVSFVPKKAENNDKKILEIIKEQVQRIAPPQIKERDKQDCCGQLIEIPIVDLHVGKQCEKEETGDDYGIEQARKVVTDSVLYFVKAGMKFDVRRCLLVFGNDFFNSDTTTNTTYGGTPQDEEKRWNYTFEKGIEIAIDIIDYCASVYNKVEVKIVQGNHDFTRSFYLGCCLIQRYANSNIVSVDNSKSPRKYFKFGNNAICFTHGSEESVARLPLIFASEAPLMWSECKFKEIHCGHLHKEKESLVVCDTESALRIRTLPSLVGKDAWHKLKGYNSIRETLAFIWDEDNGNTAILRYSL